uniref:Uncharacterized protein n=1 Tax=Anguilla anguilla TaxID=7936 RepID=A0A0E9RSS2_ANGAN
MDGIFGPQRSIFFYSGTVNFYIKAYEVITKAHKVITTILLTL